MLEYCRTWKFRNIDKLPIGKSRAWILCKFADSRGPQLYNGGFRLKIGPLWRKLGNLSCLYRYVFGKLLICRICACMEILWIPRFHVLQYAITHAGDDNWWIMIWLYINQCKNWVAIWIAYHQRKIASIPGIETAIWRCLHCLRKYAMMGRIAPPIAHRNSCATPNIVLSFGGNNSVAMINPVIFTP